MKSRRQPLAEIQAGDLTVRFSEAELDRWAVEMSARRAYHDACRPIDELRHRRRRACPPDRRPVVRAYPPAPGEPRRRPVHPREVKP